MFHTSAKITQVQHPRYAGPFAQPAPLSKVI